MTTANMKYDGHSGYSWNDDKWENIRDEVFEIFNSGYRTAVVDDSFMLIKGPYSNPLVDVESWDPAQNDDEELDKNYSLENFALRKWFRAGEDWRAG